VLLAFAGLVASWWLYVPLHELSHAAACFLSGGSVARLEIPAIHGGGLLARVIPFVVPGAGAGGRLAAFDTGGSDLVYLATDLGPFVLTIFPGVWWMRRAAAAGRGFAFGASLPFALGPILSLTGDAYEIGSIVVTSVGPWTAPHVRELLRGDDLFFVASAVRAAAPPHPWGGFSLAIVAGSGWAVATILAGAAVSRLLGRPAVDPQIISAPRLTS
jgi:hypothetical protein